MLVFFWMIRPSDLAHIKTLEVGVDGSVQANCVLSIFDFLRARATPLHCLTIQDRNLSFFCICEARREIPDAMTIYERFWKALGALDCIATLRVKFPMETVDRYGLDMLARSDKRHWEQNS
jgi:hypothetical protein